VHKPFLLVLAALAATSPAQAAVAALGAGGTTIASTAGTTTASVPADSGVTVPVARAPSSTRESTPLPDPNSMTLLSLGLAGLIFGRRIAARRQPD